MTIPQTEHCTACGAVPLYRTVNTGTFDDPSATEQMAYKCSNPRCENANQHNLTFDWVQ